MITLLSPVLAQNQVNLSPTGAFNNLAQVNIATMISTIITLVLIVAAIIFFFMLIVGGIRWMLSGGDKAGAESARGQVTGALIGLVIVFAAWAIATLLGTLFGVNIFSVNFGNFISGGGDGGSPSP